MKVIDTGQIRVFFIRIFLFFTRIGEAGFDKKSVYLKKYIGRTYMKLLFLILIFPFVSLYTQTNVDLNPIRKQAVEAMSANKWDSAAVLYEKITVAEPQNAGAWGNLASAYYNLSKFKESAGAYEKSLAIQPSPLLMYNLACSYVRAGEKYNAWPWFEKASLSGWFTSAQIRADLDLVSIHSGRFDSLMAEVDKVTRPCEFNPISRQFDFWIGEWDVFTQQGQKAGANLIQKNEDGCLLLENWTGSYGGTGKSINFFDANLKAWRQIWIDNRGSSSEFKGQYIDSVMDFRGEKTLPDDKKAKTRLRFFFMSTEKVRQFAEQSVDDGKTWQTTYDFIYIKRK